MKWRYEQFGGIVASEAPPLLAFVDRAFLRRLGAEDSPLWDGPERAVGRLSAPTEVHLALTNTCPVGCQHCYMSAGAPDAEELDTAGMRSALTALARLGVFHVALGGGEALARDDLFELGQHARSLGLVPNLTLSGALLTPELARRLRLFGQVNVSMDGVGALYGIHRGGDAAVGFGRADRALRLLQDAGVSTGINCVLGRASYGGLGELFDYAAELQLSEIEVLRLKPSGRGRKHYARARCTDEQHRQLIPMLQRLSERSAVAAKIDCSFVPMLCWHEPPIEALEATATYGCEAGNVLLGARSDGRVAGCSFLPPLELRIADLGHRFRTDPRLEALRSWADHAPEPCASCPYLRVCKGGCRAVAAHVRGDPLAPDPECPRVIQLREARP